MADPKYINHLRTPLDLLVADWMPLHVRVYLLLADAHPHPASVQTVSNILGATRQQTRNAYSLLARRGLISRSDGAAKMNPDALPDFGGEQLRNLRGHLGRGGLQRDGIPTPVKVRLQAAQQSAQDRLTYRLTEAQYLWLHSAGVFDDPGFLVFSLPKMIEESATLVAISNGLVERVRNARIEGANTLGAMEAMVLHLVTAAHAVHELGGVNNPGGLIRTMASDLAAGEARGNGAERQIHRLLESLRTEPLTTRKTIKEHSEAGTTYGDVDADEDLDSALVAC